jgi:hypothetical protein
LGPECSQATLVHLALINSETILFAMRFVGRNSSKCAVLASVACLTVGACASGRAAPIMYAAKAPAAGVPRLPAVSETARVPLDLTSIPFDGTNAPMVLADQPYSECVPYARAVSGIQIWGDAVTWWTQAANSYVRSTRPAPGSVLVLRGWNDTTRGHVSSVREVVSSRLLRVDHANWLKNGEVSLNVPVIDVSEANDWSKVRVWHVPGGYWGGRTYEVEGFIQPYRLDGGSFSG